METLTSGAEAVIKKDNNQINKERVKKDYRLKELDEKLRKQRTKRETKILEKLDSMNFPAPKVNSTTDYEIHMDFIEGEKLRDVLHHNPSEYSEELGKKLAKLHNNGIIHGDLTTSNMILKDEIYFIDFGLSLFSDKIEDMAVDLHLLKQALESKHHKIWEESFQKVIEGYKELSNNAEEVLKRLETVENRGRNKTK